jgi:hypothetical protein
MVKQIKFKVTDTVLTVNRGCIGGSVLKPGDAFKYGSNYYKVTSKETKSIPGHCYNVEPTKMPKAKPARNGMNSFSF